jgi:hypothetical protein
MGHESRVVKIEPLQQLLRPFGVTPDLVDLRSVRLVGAPGAEEVGTITRYPASTSAGMKFR